MIRMFHLSMAEVRDKEKNEEYIKEGGEGGREGKGREGREGREGE